MKYVALTFGALILAFMISGHRDRDAVLDDYASRQPCSEGSMPQHGDGEVAWDQWLIRSTLADAKAPIPPSACPGYVTTPERAREVHATANEIRGDR